MAGHRPDFAINLHQLPAGGQAIQLFQQQTPFPPAAKTELSNQLFVARALTLRSGNALQKFLVCHPSSLRLARLRGL